MDFREIREGMSKELAHFERLLNDALPRYNTLLERHNLSAEETAELGDLEYFLLEINARINDIKQQLEMDLFGHSLDHYYKLKQKAQKGDKEAAQKMAVMRRSFQNALQSDVIFNWN